MEGTSVASSDGICSIIAKPWCDSSPCLAIVVLFVVRDSGTDLSVLDSERKNEKNHTKSKLFVVIKLK